MLRRLDYFTYYKILFFSFKNTNVKMKKGIIVASDKLNV